MTAKPKLSSLVDAGEIRRIPIKDITIEDRVREEMGDLEFLAASLKEHGQLHPITLNQDLHVVAGGRRFVAASTILKWDTILARVIINPTKEQLLLLELFENIARKDFSWHESCENLLRLHEHLSARAKAKHQKWSITKTAEYIKIPLSTLAADTETAKWVREFPQLKKLETKFQARKEYGELIKIVQAETSRSNMSSSEAAQLDALLNLMNTSKQSKEKSFSRPIEVDDATEFDDEQFLPEEMVTECAPSPADQNPFPPLAYHQLPWEELLPTIPSGQVGFIEIDPPYAIRFNETYGQAEDLDTRTFEDWTVETYQDHIPRLLKECFRLLLDNSWIFFWCPFEHITFTQDAAAEAGFRTQLPGVWGKPGAASNSPSTTLIRNMETYLLFRKGNATFNSASFKALFMHNTTSSKERIHVTEKPVELYTMLFQAFGRIGHLFLSPFAGSGNSLIASAFYGMPGIGCDPSETYKSHFLHRCSLNLKG